MTIQVICSQFKFAIRLLLLLVLVMVSFSDIIFPTFMHDSDINKLELIANSEYDLDTEKSEKNEKHEPDFYFNLPFLYSAANQVFFKDSDSTFYIFGNSYTENPTPPPKQLSVFI